jgi:hypothetical protein
MFAVFCSICRIGHSFENERDVRIISKRVIESRLFLCGRGLASTNAWMNHTTLLGSS